MVTQCEVVHYKLVNLRTYNLSVVVRCMDISETLTPVTNILTTFNIVAMETTYRLHVLIYLKVN